MRFLFFFKIIIIYFLLNLELGYGQTQDFKVQHIQDDIGNAGGTNTTITSVASLNNAVALANNNRKTHAGRSDLIDSNLVGRDMAGARRLTAIDELSYYRESGSVNANMRFNSSIWEYIGPLGGCNEMIVRGRFEVSLSETTNSVILEGLTNVINADKCIPFITGIMNDVSLGGADSGTAIAYLENSTTMRVQKGSEANNVTVYITLVEFTGSNWTVLHGDSDDVGDNLGTIDLYTGSNGSSGSSGNVSSWSEAIIFGHFRADNNDSGVNQAIADLWPILEPGATDEVDWRFNTNSGNPGHDSNGTNRHFVHVLNNPYLSVNRFQNNSTVADETTINISTTSLSSINEALIVGSSMSRGGGIAYGRGWRNYYLKPSIDAAHWAHRSGNNDLIHEIQIVDLSGLTSQDIDVVDSSSNAIGDESVDSPSATNDTEFGNVIVSTPVTKTYTIENNGSCDLSISSITSNNSDFVVSSIPTTISGNSSQSFDVTYSPTAKGTSSALITITSNTLDLTKQTYTFTVQGTGTLSYCASNGNMEYGTGITMVLFNTLENKTDPIKVNGYEDFKSLSTDVAIGSSHVLKVNLNTDGDYTVYAKAWIDWNQNGDFTDDGEEYNLGSATNVSDGVTSISPSIIIPIDAILGSTTMRVVARWPGVSTDPCEQNFDGEVEDYTINIVCDSNEWTGVDDNDWNNELNWSCNQIPTDVSTILIPASLSTFPVIYESDNFGVVGNIEIESGASLTIIDNSIEISGNLLLNGLIDLQGEGQLIQFEGSTLDVSSGGSLERDQQGTADLYTYNYWASPVGVINTTSNNNSYTLSDVLYDGTNKVNFIPGKDGSNSNPVTISEYWIYTYVNKNGDYSEWDQVGSSETINAGEGYTMKGPGSGIVSEFQNYSFKGKPNNGDISLNITDGYEYLVGNPYPSALDADQFIVDNGPTIDGGASFDGTLYFWEHWGGGSHKLADYQGGYATYNLSGGVGNGSKAPEDGSSKVPLRFIPVAQGFFVKAEADGTVDFKNQQRVFEMEKDGGSIFMKEEPFKKTVANKSTSKDTRSKIRLGFEAPEIGHRQILLTIDDRATDNVDWGFDGKKLDELEQDLYWDLDADKYIIQALPDVNLDREIPLGITMGKSGIATIKIDELENINDYLEIYIKDALTGLTHQINNIPFEIELEAGEYVNRFALVFAPNNTLSDNEEILENGLFVYVNNTSEELQIRNNTNSSIERVRLFSSLGQLLQSWNKGLDNTTIALPVSNKSTGVYIVQIVSESGTISKKVVIE